LTFSFYSALLFSGLAGVWEAFVSVPKQSILFHRVSIIKRYYQSANRLYYFRLLLAGPGPALFVAASGFPKVMYYWWPANLIGVVLAEQAKKLF
jgi:hypothetical protein